jgi:hypothetical protein
MRRQCERLVGNSSSSESERVRSSSNAFLLFHTLLQAPLLPTRLYSIQAVSC